MRKADLLQLLHDRGGAWTNRDLALAFQVPEAQAGCLACKLAAQGLVDRAWRSSDDRRVTWISPRGIARLAYWAARDQRLAEQQDQDQDDVEFVEVVATPSPGGQLDDQQLDEDEEASTDDAPDETLAEHEGLARFFRPH